MALVFPDSPRPSTRYRIVSALMPSSRLAPLDPVRVPGPQVHQAPKVEAVVLHAAEVPAPEIVDVAPVEEAARRERALEDLVLGPARERAAQPGRQRHPKALLGA